MKRKDWLLLISLSSLLVFPVLFSLRAYDDNSLTSWIWTFRDGREIVTFLCIAAVIPLAYVFSRKNMPSGNRMLFLLGISFAATVPMWSSPETIIDASRYFTQAKYLETYGMGSFLAGWGTGIDAWTDMPLVPFLYGLIFRFAGEERIFIQLFTSSLFSLTVLLAYLTGREFMDEEAAFTGAILLLGVPYLLTQIPLMLVDVPVMFFLALSVYTYITALKRGGGLTIVSAAAAVTLTVYSKYSAWLMLSVLGVISVLYLSFPRIMLPGFLNGDDDVRDRDCRFSGRGSMQLLMPRIGGVAFFTCLFAGAVFYLKSDLILDQISLLVSYQKPGLGRWSESFISTFLFQTHPFITAGAIFSLYVAFRDRDPRIIAISWLVLIVLVLQIRRIRYVIMVFPMLSLMAGYGFRRIRDEGVRAFLVMTVVGYSLVIAYSGYLPFVRSMTAANLMEAGKYLDSLPDEYVKVITAVPDDLVANPSVTVPILDLHTKKKIVFDYDPASFGIPEEEKVTSSLRFTWQYVNPEYYADNIRKEGIPVVVITDDTGKVDNEPFRSLLEGYSPVRSFDRNDDVFRFRSLILVFREKI